jgi:heme exporter protein B
MASAQGVLAEARLVATKDLRVEWRSRVVLNQVLPFALLVLVMFGFALDADTGTLRAFTAGLFWVAVLLAALLAVQRSFALETEDAALEGLRLSGMAPAAIFAGKACAIVLQLLVLEVVLGFGVVIFYGAEIDDAALAVITGVVAAIGVGAAGTLYGVLAASLKVRETILPILLLPVLAPVLIGATRAFDDAFGSAAVNGWSWLAMLALFALVYAVFGALAFGALLEES